MKIFTIFMLIFTYSVVFAGNSKPVIIPHYNGITKSITSKSGNTRYYSNGKYLGYSKQNNNNQHYYNSNGKYLGRSYETSKYSQRYILRKN
jgi:hypothetical protein